MTKEQQLKMFEMLEEMMNKQLKMVSNILDIESIESGKIHIELEKVELVEVSNEVINTYKDRAAKKGIELNFNTESEKVFVHAHKSYLADQVFGNLLSNAIKFSSEGSTVEMILLESGKHLRWGIKDEGPGISEEDMKKLFGKYQKLSATPTAGEPSTGLGLSIVKRFVEEMKGKVWCESNLGEGTTFWVELPLYQDENGE